MNLPDATAIILVETDAYTEADAVVQMSKVVEVFRKNSAARIQTADSAAEAEALWRARKSAGSVAGRLRPNNVSEDVTVPISKVPDLLSGISAIVQRYHLFQIW